MSPPGLQARDLARRAVDGVLRRGVPLDEVFEDADLPGRDLALARAIAAGAMRRFGTIGRILDGLLTRGLPRKSGSLEAILATAAAQILFLGVPDHAAVDLAVRLCRQDPNSAGFAGLANAVLRRLSAEKPTLIATVPPFSDTPAWLMQRWRKSRGRSAAEAIALAHLVEPALDLSVKADAAAWATRLGGIELPTGTVRLIAGGPVAALPGYEEGAWWVQDMAASLPARLLGKVRGKRVLDLCAAPGGKTAQLAAAGARVTALDRSGPRLARLEANMRRLGLTVETIVADALAFRAEPFDAVLLDAPCSATGTIRRHPDIAWAKREADIATLARMQGKMLAHAASLVRPGGLLVYCTCSLEPEEGEAQAAAFLAATQGFERVRVKPGEIGGLAEAIDDEGDLRTLPSMLAHDDARLAGMDGFFAARFRRIA